MHVGIIGLSPGNGHPFSFSAITNGYDRDGFGEAGWPVILDYLMQQPSEAFGFGPQDGLRDRVRVTHAWTQDDAITRALCKACNIDNAVDRFTDMADAVDAVIIARDDWERHRDLAAPFLEAGLPVFVDKPLSLDRDDLAWFRPWLENGQLMSCSGMRHAVELDAVRTFLAGSGPLRHISATVLNGLDKYGIHMLDALSGLLGCRPIQVRRLDAAHEAFHFVYADGLTLQLNCLGAVGKTFHMSYFARDGHYHMDLHDNFSAFRRTLGHFYRQAATGEAFIRPEEVLGTMDLMHHALALAPGEEWKADHG